ncbi:MAG: CPBP family intramembrane metalloprotease [Verrucomicrobia bacterium]|nr:CPBP family intramembrane metalloprotease [Verrucomicrobiota bacterium]
MNHPLLLALFTAAGLYVGHLWRADLRAARARRPNPNALPGATDAPRRAVIIAMAGALGLLAAETIGEHALGLAAQQSRMTWLFGLYSVTAAPIIEEVIFRGWLVLDGPADGSRRRATMWAAAVGASLGFAALHPFLWRWDDAGFALTPGAKGWFSTAVVFATSLWLYVARLAPWNPRQSLLPCFAGHAAKNLGVVAIKSAAGFMD